MKNKRFFRKFLVLAAVMFSMTAFSVTAYAGGGEAVEPPPAETPPPQTETTPEPVPLTPEGNLSLVDDIESAGSEDKQFIKRQYLLHYHGPGGGGKKYGPLFEPGG